MIKELNKIESLFIKNYGQKITNLTIENACDEYFGFNFQIEKLNFKFRKSKITPKKVGQFVTLGNEILKNKPNRLTKTTILIFSFLYQNKMKSLVSSFSQKNF